MEDRKKVKVDSPDTCPDMDDILARIAEVKGSINSPDKIVKIDDMAITSKSQEDLQIMLNDLNDELAGCMGLKGSEKWVVARRRGFN